MASSGMKQIQTGITPVKIGSDTDWTAIAAGSGHSLALKSDGTLWAWGDNSYGQLGDGTTDNKIIPTKVGSNTDWTAIAAGSGHSLALKSDGIWSWGDNSYGQLGDGTTDNKIIPTKVGLDTSWKAIASGSYHSLALKTGTLWAWGDNTYGQIANGTMADQTTPLQASRRKHLVFCSGGQLVAVIIPLPLNPTGHSGHGEEILQANWETVRPQTSKLRYR